jgi:hypothetical protein
LFRREIRRGFQVRDIAIPSGSQLAYDPTQWQGTVVLVERGRIELECLDGRRRVFGPGNVLFFVGLGLQTIHNAGTEALMLIAVSRRPRPLS